MFSWMQLTLFLYIAARMSGFVLFNPIFGRTNIPRTFQSGFILVLSICLYSATTQTVSVPDTTVELILRILLELALGYLLGLVVQFFYYIPQLAGTVVDTQMGMTMNQIYDATSQTNTTVTGLLLNALMTLLFFAANGHHTLLRILLTSGELVAFGGVSLTQTMAASMLELFAECTVLGVKLSLPILVAELMGQVGMGVLMKVIPQINIFVINIDIKIAIGLILLLMLISPFSEFLLKAEASMLTYVSKLLTMAAG